MLKMPVILKSNRFKISRNLAWPPATQKVGGAELKVGEGAALPNVKETPTHWTSFVHDIVKIVL